MNYRFTKSTFTSSFRVPSVSLALGPGRMSTYGSVMYRGLLFRITLPPHQCAANLFSQLLKTICWRRANGVYVTLASTNYRGQARYSFFKGAESGSPIQWFSDSTFFNKIGFTVPCNYNRKWMNEHEFLKYILNIYRKCLKCLFSPSHSWLLALLPLLPHTLLHHQG